MYYLSQYYNNIRRNTSIGDQLRELKQNRGSTQTLTEENVNDFSDAEFVDDFEFDYNFILDSSSEDNGRTTNGIDFEVTDNMYEQDNSYYNYDSYDDYDSYDNQDVDTSFDYESDNSWINEFDISWMDQESVQEENVYDNNFDFEGSFDYNEEAESDNMYSYTNGRY